MARTATHKPRTNKDKVTELHLATYNVRTLSDECHLVSLENEIEKIKWDIIGISEMRRPGENVVELASQHIMFNKGNDKKQDFQIGAGLYAVGRPVQKRNDEDGQIGTIQSLPLERGALFNRFFGEPAHGPPHVAGGASGPIGGCRDESRTDNPDLDLQHVFDRNNRKTDLI